MKVGKSLEAELQREKTERERERREKERREMQVSDGYKSQERKEGRKRLN